MKSPKYTAVKKFLLPLIYIASLAPVTAQVNYQYFNRDNPAPAGHHKAKERIDLTDGFVWSAGDGQERVMEADWNMITDLESQTRVGHNGMGGGYQNIATPNKDIVLTLQPGGINADFSVSDNGSVNYTVPIEVPEGSGEVTPQLQIIYNSYAGFGLCGYGTTLSGISSIIRIPKTLARNGAASPVSFTDSDQLAFDGMALISADPGKYIPELSSGTSYVCERSGNGFKVSFSDGSIAEFGLTEESQLWYQGKTRPAVCNINKYTAANGFYMTYSYRNDKGNVLLSSIAYGMNDGSAGYPKNEQNHSEIRFFYSSVKETRNNYLLGAERANNQIISQICTYSDKKLQRTYWFDYSYAQGTTLLKQITYRFSDGSMLNPTVFNWSIPENKNITTVSYPNPAQNVSLYFAPRTFVTRPEAKMWKLTVAKERSVTYDVAGISGSAGTYYVPVRLNDDMYTDLLKVEKGIVYVYHGSATGLGSPVDQVSGFTQEYALGVLGTKLFFGDFDGDGFNDIMGFAADKSYSKSQADVSGPYLNITRYKPLKYMCRNGKFTNEMATADFDYFKIPGVSVATSGYVDVSSLLNEGVFAIPYINEGLCGDFDGDGKSEIILSFEIKAFGLVNDTKKYEAITYTAGGGAGIVYYMFKNGVFTLQNTPVIRVYPGSNNRHDFTLTEAPDNIAISMTRRTIDVDGDGADELVIPSSGHVLKINISGSTYTTSAAIGNYFPSTNSQFYTQIVDFNGDGLLDKATFDPKTGTITKYFNTGSGFSTPISDVFPQFATKTGILGAYSVPKNSACDYSAPQADAVKDLPRQVSNYQSNLFFADINNDGIIETIVNQTSQVANVKYSKLYSKIVWPVPEGSPPGYINYCYYYTEQTDLVSLEPAKYQLHIINGSSIETIETSQIATFGDFNGDGKVDGLTSTGLLTSQFSNTDMHINQFADGNGTNTYIMNRESLGSIQKSSSIGTIPDNNISIFKAPLPAVTQYVVFSNNAGIYESNVTYCDPLVHKESGFMGTSTMRIATTRDDFKVEVKVLKKSFVETKFYGRSAKKNVLLAKNADVYLQDRLPIAGPESSFSTAGQISRSVTVTEALNGSGISSAILRTKSLVETNNITNITKTTNYSYSTGSVTDIKPYSFFQLLSPIGYTTTEGKISNTTSLEYEPNRYVIKTINKTVAFDGKSSLEKTTYEYPSSTSIRPQNITVVRGKVSSRTDFVYSENKVTATTAAVGGTDALVTVTEYDPTFRFVLSDSKTSSKGIAFKNAYEYDYATGNLLKETGHVGLPTEYKTSYTYDVYGNRTKTMLPDGDVITSSLEALSYGYRSITNTSAYNGTETTEYDSRGRTVSAQSPGYNGKVQTVHNSYDDINRTIIQGSVIPGNAITIEADEYGRTVKQSTPGNSVTATHNGLNKTVTKNVNGYSVTETYSFLHPGVLSSMNHSQWGALTFSNFDAFANPQKTDVLTTSSTALFEDGLQKELNDPSAGLSKTTYNADGSAKTTTDAENNYMDNTVDNFLRPTTTTWNGGQLTNVYDTKFPGKLSTSTMVHNGATTATAYEYDKLGRTTSVAETIDGEVFTARYTYDNMGKVLTKTYPNGLVVAYEYSGTSLVGLYKNSISAQNLIWKLVNTDAYGRITESKCGNGNVTVREYQGDKGELSAIRIGAYDRDSYIRQYEYSYNASGNLISQRILSGIDGIPGLSETYTYDAKDQLISTNDQKYSYDSKGNITNIGGYAKLYYGSKPFTADSAAFSPNYPQSYLSQQISYTPWRKIDHIKEYRGVHNYGEYTFAYGPDFQRRKMAALNQNAGQFVRYYSGDYEELRMGFGNSALVARQYCYIPAPDGTIALYIANPSDVAHGELYYLHTDRIGTVHMITDASQMPAQLTYPYDNLQLRDFIPQSNSNMQVFNTSAWGIRTWAQNGALVEGGCITDRGFTFQEHLWNVQLVNMNGRMYDPFQGRFLSPDPYIQDPLNPLNHNRYAYCLNNPTKYTDPSGEFWHIIIGAAVGGVINLAITWNSCDGFWEHAAAFGVGAGAGALTAATGGAAAGTFMASSGAALGAAAIGGAATSATNNLISQTGKNFSGPVDWGQVGINSAVGAVAGIASYGAGQWAGANLGGTFNASAGIKSPVLSQGISGMVGGAAGGAAAGFTAGYLLSGLDLEAGWDGAVNGMISGAVIGGAAGAAGGYISAKAEGRSPWTGDKTHIQPKSVGARGRAVDIKKINVDYLESNGLDAHTIKYEYLGNKAPISRYDLYQTSSGQIIILPKGGAGEPIYTGYILP